MRRSLGIEPAQTLKIAPGGAAFYGGQGGTRTLNP